MKIEPLTHKMKNRVREHGDEWGLLKSSRDTDGDLVFLITPEHHLERLEPYCVWVKNFKDVVLKFMPEHKQA